MERNSLCGSAITFNAHSFSFVLQSKAGLSGSVVASLPKSCDVWNESHLRDSVRESEFGKQSLWTDPTKTTAVEFVGSVNSFNSMERHDSTQIGPGRCKLIGRQIRTRWKCFDLIKHLWAYDRVCELCDGGGGEEDKSSGRKRKHETRKRCTWTSEAVCVCLRGSASLSVSEGEITRRVLWEDESQREDLLNTWWVFLKDTARP